MAEPPYRHNHWHWRALPVPTYFRPFGRTFPSSCEPARDPQAVKAAEAPPWGSTPAFPTTAGVGRRRQPCVRAPNVAYLVGAMPRRRGMERRPAQANAKTSAPGQGHQRRFADDVRVLVVGGPQHQRHHRPERCAGCSARFTVTPRPGRAITRSSPTRPVPRTPASRTSSCGYSADQYQTSPSRRLPAKPATSW